MDISFQSLIFFIIVTIIYFVFPSIGKPQLKLVDLTEEGVSPDFYNRNIKSLAFYFGLVVVSQLCLNVGYLMSKCGGSLDKNIGAAALFTFIPWILIFGVMLAVLIIFPNFKSAFSNVIGYYVVAGGANDIFGSILLGTDLNEMIETTNDETEKNKLTKAAEAIIKICGNKSILINQMNPDNFISVWNTLNPLMKTDIKNSPETINQIQTELLNLVVLKDNIGEAFWYIYTAILISSIVYYNLATRGCVKNVDQIKADHDAYIKQQEETNKQSEIDNSTTYTIS